MFTNKGLLDMINSITKRGAKYDLAERVLVKRRPDRLIWIMPAEVHGIDREKSKTASGAVFFVVSVRINFIR
ncbi:hypothetical protein AMD01_19595 [Priestia koreensis]|uniref:Uncharacterized protein n=1 Tax=Priestia koreensis TaxID=284581 RepID=A0A0M0KQM5_9BACI|nr:hypothetical protein AMD01_19595 [Priestia koreensis]